MKPIPAKIHFLLLDVGDFGVSTSEGMGLASILSCSVVEDENLSGNDRRRERNHNKSLGF